MRLTARRSSAKISREPPATSERSLPRPNVSTSRAAVATPTDRPCPRRPRRSSLLRQRLHADESPPFVWGSLSIPSCAKTRLDLPLGGGELYGRARHVHLVRGHRLGFRPALKCWRFLWKLGTHGRVTFPARLLFPSARGLGQPPVAGRHRLPARGESRLARGAR